MEREEERESILSGLFHSHRKHACTVGCEQESASNLSGSFHSQLRGWQLA